MYIYDRHVLGPQDRSEEQPIILRPSRRYHYANPDDETRTGIYGLALAGLGQLSAQSLAQKLKHLSFFPHFVEVNGKDVPLNPGDMDPKIYDGPQNYKIAPGLQDCLKPVMV